MSDSVQPHRRQPIRLPCPWDSPVKNTGVGCHFLLQCMKVKSGSEVAQSYPTHSHGLQPTRLLRPWDFPGKSTRVGCHCLLPSIHDYWKNHTFDYMDLCQGLCTSIISVKEFIVNVVVNFMCQLDSVMLCSDIWSNFILGVSVKLFLCAGNMNKTNCPSSCG